MNAPGVMLAFPASRVWGGGRPITEALRGPRISPTSARNMLDNFLEDWGSPFLPLGLCSPAFAGRAPDGCLFYRESVWYHWLPG